MDVFIIFAGIVSCCILTYLQGYEDGTDSGRIDVASGTYVCAKTVLERDVVWTCEENK